jgi:hypothetical protein
VSEDELIRQVKRAVELAREALEEDEAEARARGRGASSPDTSSVSALAAGILVANALETRHALEVELLRAASSTAKRRATPRSRSAS